MASERRAHGEAFWADPQNAHLTRCAATLRNGDPCRREAIMGGNVCGLHGGDAGQVRRKAAERVVRTADEAVEAIVKLISDPAAPYGIRLKAAQDIADRAGLAATQMHKVVTDESDPVLSLLTEVLEDPQGLENPPDFKSQVTSGVSSYELEPPPPEPERPKVERGDSTPPARLRKDLRY